MSANVRLALGCAPPDFTPLFPDDGEFTRSASVLARLRVSGALPAEAQLSLYAYELVERVLDGVRGGDRRFAALLWPPCLFDALAVEPHAWPELELLLPRSLAPSWRAPRDADVAAECVRLGLPELAPEDYLRALHDAAEKARWPRRFLPPAGFGGAPEESTAAGFLLREGRILLELRPRDARVTPGVWDVPGGHIGPGEAAEQALAREFREELGVEVRAPRRARELDALEPPRGRRYRHVLFVVESFTGEPRSREGQHLRWFTPEEALCLPDLNEPTGFALQELVEEELLSSPNRSG